MACTQAQTAAFRAQVRGSSQPSSSKRSLMV
jgi:hypothetical protein